MSFKVLFNLLLLIFSKDSFQAILFYKNEYSSILKLQMRIRPQFSVPDNISGILQAQNFQIIE